MKSKTIMYIVVGLVLVGIIYLIVRSRKKTEIKDAAIAAGLPVSTATTVANSSNPATRLMSMGVPMNQANLISKGINPNTGRLASSNSSSSRLKCPEGFSEVVVNTPGGSRVGCQGYVAGSNTLQFTYPS